MAGVDPEDVDVAQLYDAFTPLVLGSLEEYGFCKPGEAGAFVENGGLEVGGRLPNNTSGGSLSEAYVHGINLIIEAVRQIRGTRATRCPGARCRSPRAATWCRPARCCCGATERWPTRRTSGARAAPTGSRTGRPDGAVSCASSVAPTARRGAFRRDRCVHAVCRSPASGRRPAAGRRLVSWVVCHPPLLPVWKERAPYVVVLVECEEGVRTMGNLLDAGADDLRMDMPMIVDFAPSPDGDLVPQWRPAG